MTDAICASCAVLLYIWQATLLIKMINESNFEHTLMIEYHKFPRGIGASATSCPS